MNPFTIRSAGFGVLSLLVGAIGTIALARYESAVRADIDYHHLRTDHSRARKWFAEWRFTSAGDVHSIRSMSDQGFGEGGPDFLPFSFSTLPAWSRISQTRGDDLHCGATLIEMPYGWPMRSMVSEWYEPGINGPSGDHTCIIPAAGTLMNGGWFAMPWWTDGFMDRTKSLDQWLGGTVRYEWHDMPRFFPTRIVPLGFIVNSLCYAASFWLALTTLLTAFHTESRMMRLCIGNWRARRGECRACGHVLAASVLCPECGEQVRA